MDNLLFALENEYFGNALSAYLIALGIFVVILLLFKIFENVILTRLKRLAEKTETDIDDTAVAVIEGIPFSLYFFIALYFGAQSLNVPTVVMQGLKFLLVIFAVYAGIKVTRSVVKYLLFRSAKKNGKESMAQNGLLIITDIVLWSTGLLLVLSNMGVNITAFVASLGIGGIAVALAAQNILEDLFSSFSIYFDKPFEIGDYIVVGSDRGTVKKIGLKTTRIQSLGGEELVIANKELTSSRVQNFRKLKKRRINFSVGVTYETAQTKLKKIPKMIAEIIKKVKNADFDRAHLYEFGDSALVYEIVYYVKSDDYKIYMDVQQKINLELIAIFTKEGIEFAYPTQVQYVHQV